MLSLKLMLLDTPLARSALYQMMNADDRKLVTAMPKWRNQESFKKWFETQAGKEIRHMFLLYLQSYQDPVGYLHDYAYDIKQGTCKLNVYIVPMFRELGIACYASGVMMSLLFERYSLSSVVLPVFFDNEYSRRNVMQAGGEYSGLKTLIGGRQVAYYRISHQLFQERFTFFDSVRDRMIVDEKAGIANWERS